MSTIRQLQQRHQNKIKPAELELLVAFIMKKKKEWVISHPEYNLNAERLARLKKTIRRVQNGFSVAAITGHKEFYGLDFFVDKHVLIPRPETELLVEKTINEIEKERSQKITLIDTGTGSGCIPISIAKNIVRPVPIVAMDISPAALRIAKKNAKQYKIKIKFLRGNLLNPLVKYFPKKTKKGVSFYITANLPYLTQKQFASEPSIKKEPETALVADNKKGLSLYEKLFGQIQKILPKGKIKIFIEIDPRQSKGALKLAQKYFPTAKIDRQKDLSGWDRLVIIERYS
jgi:release factor glutamine methyltransferase